MALAFGIWAVLSGNLLLVLLAVFVFMAGTAELMQVQWRSLQARNEMGGHTAPWPYRGGDIRSSTAGWVRPGAEQDSEDVIDAIEVRQIR